MVAPINPTEAMVNSAATSHSIINRCEILIIRSYLSAPVSSLSASSSRGASDSVNRYGPSMYAERTSGTVVLPPICVS